MKQNKKSNGVNYKMLNQRDSIVNTSFYIGLIIKGFDALAELVGGCLLLSVNHDWVLQVIRLIAAPELGEDPTDIIMNYIIKFGDTFSLTSQHAVAVYLLIHGVMKIIIIGLLWTKQLRAYIPAAFAFVVFIVYETYSWIQTPSIILALFISIDIVMTFIIILEYRRIKEERQN